MTADDTDGMTYRFAVDLSEQELLSIGRVIALWGSLEHEIFSQTLECLNPASLDDLPKVMNNLQFSKVLELWKLHVADKATDKRKTVLQDQYNSICHHYEFRNAIVHGMWDWSTGTPEKITVLRVRKKEIHSTHFTAADLRSFASELEIINFKLRYPGGYEDYAEAMAEQGLFMNRLGFCLMTDNPLALDLLPPGIADALKKLPD